MTANEQSRLGHTPSGRLNRTKASVGSFSNDVAEGFFEIFHNTFALLGLVVVFAVMALTVKPELRQTGEAYLMTWLQERQPQEAAAEPVEPEYVELKAVERATAANPKELPESQAALAFWLSRKYGVAPEPLSVLVSHAFEIGLKAKLDPALILAVMAIESGFNPFAQSPVGAQGLMQVMTKVHTDKYDGFGGQLAAFDPVTNLRVGVKVLQECIARAGSVEEGLKHYVGAANLASDGGYAGKVMAEHARLSAVLGGKRLPATKPLIPPTRIIATPAGPIPVSAPATRATDRESESSSSPDAS
ncbi:MAG: lytic transglycosylase domain-containing protein [Polaromonas sp.]|nr:lytic transglycosylase domain-containing protein [Polaromonas sp.]